MRLVRGWMVLGAWCVYRMVYAPIIRRFRTTATLLGQLANGMFENATNLSAFSCAGSGVRSVAGLAFSGCASLVGRRFFLPRPN